MVTMGLFAWGIRFQSGPRTPKDKLRPIVSVELYAKTAQRNADSELAKAREEAAQIIGNANADERVAREEAAAIIGNKQKESSQP